MPTLAPDLHKKPHRRLSSDIRRHRTMFSILRFLLLSLYFAQAHAQAPATRYESSPELLRQSYLAAIDKRDKFSAWNLFCPAVTSDRIFRMYRAMVEDTVTLPIRSVDLAAMTATPETIPHSTPLHGRLVFKYDLARQQGPERIGASTFYYGRTPAGFCLALPEIREAQ